LLPPCLPCLEYRSFLKYQSLRQLLPFLKYPQSKQHLLFLPCLKFQTFLE
jgi:hypothetical protein